MEDLKKIALENIRNFIKVTPKKDILSRLAILSGDSKEGYVISSIISEDFINYCNRDLPIEEMVVVQVNWPDIAYFFHNNFVSKSSFAVRSIIGVEILFNLTSFIISIPVK